MATQQTVKEQKSALFSIDGNAGSLSQYKLPAGVVSVDAMLPDPVKAVLAAQFKAVGLNFDVSKLALNKDNRQVLEELRTTVTLIKNNTKLLPAIAGILKQAMQAATAKAQFNADIAKAALLEQAKIDSAQADILLALMGYRSKRDRVEMKLQRRQQLQQRIQQARSKYYETTWGKKLNILMRFGRTLRKWHSTRLT